MMIEGMQKWVISAAPGFDVSIALSESTQAGLRQHSTDEDGASLRDSVLPGEGQTLKWCKLLKSFKESFEKYLVWARPDETGSSAGLGAGTEIS